MYVCKNGYLVEIIMSVKYLINNYSFTIIIIVASKMLRRAFVYMHTSLSLIVAISCNTAE